MMDDFWDLLTMMKRRKRRDVVDDESVNYQLEENANGENEEPDVQAYGAD